MGFVHNIIYGLRTSITIPLRIHCLISFILCTITLCTHLLYMMGIPSLKIASLYAESRCLLYNIYTSTDVKYGLVESTFCNNNNNYNKNVFFYVNQIIFYFFFHSFCCRCCCCCCCCWRPHCYETFMNASYNKEALTVKLYKYVPQISHWKMALASSSSSLCVYCIETSLFRLKSWKTLIL